VYFFCERLRAINGTLAIFLLYLDNWKPGRATDSTNKKLGKGEKQILWSESEWNIMGTGKCKLEDGGCRHQPPLSKNVN
jgi:hypothetical protein